MPELAAVVRVLRMSTEGLVRALAEAPWTDGDVAKPSLLPGWTRGHVLTHIARNADAVTRTLSGALRGEIVARYPEGGRARDRDIEAGAARHFAAIAADVTESASRLDSVLDPLTEADAWDRPTDVHRPSYENRPASYWMSVRLREVEIHRVDLAADYGPDRWPPLLVSMLLPEVAETLGGRAHAAVRVSVTVEGSVVPELTGSEWSAGAGEPAVEVSGPDWAVLAWMLGRGSVVADVLGPAPELARWR
jgi:maleylpyruvate isomerase